jgi:3'(2'), 5'-bisphosphate nucleotidase
MHEFVITALSVHMPAVLRWAGSVARRLRGHDISVSGKSSGSAATDALTLADLSLQELIVAALRDCDPIFRHCRIDAEESTGDLGRFPSEAELTIGLDPIDGTKKYRDRSGGAYSVMLHLRSKATVLYSLVYQPEQGTDGWWVEAQGERIISGPDDHSRPAADVLRSLSASGPAGLQTGSPNEPPRIYMTGFMQSEPEAIRRVQSVGIDGSWWNSAPQAPYQLFASGELCGALIHSPNVYDFPVTLHLCRILGGDAVWVHNGQSVHFHETWLDARSDMRRLPGIVACSSDPEILQKLVDLSRNWNPERYRTAPDL